VVLDGCGMTYKLSKGTIQYQKTQRELTERKILNCILKSNSLPASRNIWTETKINKNNIKCILDKLIKEGKIIKFKNVKTSQIFQTKQQRKEQLRYQNSDTYYDWEDFIVRRMVSKDIYVPNMRNKEMFDFVKQTHLKIFTPLYNYEYRKEGIKFHKAYRKKYSKWSIEEAFVRIKGSRQEFYGDDDFLKIIHDMLVGESLIFLLHLTKNLPEKIPSKKFLEKTLMIKYKNSNN